MNTQKAITFVVVMAAIVAVLWGVNYYLVKPRLKPVLSAVPQLPPPPPSQQFTDANAVAASLQIIKAATQSEAPAEFTPRLVERNPFLWPGEAVPPERPPQPTGQTVQAEPEPDNPIVHLIIIGENKKLAVLNDSMVFEGSKFNGRTVARIEPDAVFLSSTAGRETRLDLPALGYGHLRERQLEDEARREAASREAEAAAAQQTAEGGQQPDKEAIFQLMQRLAPLLMEGQGAPAGGQPQGQGTK